MNLKTFGTAEQSAVSQIERCIAGEDGAIGVLCAYNHKGYLDADRDVVAYRGYVSPSGVGYDIACGNMAVQTDLQAKDVAPTEFARLADEIAGRVNSGVGRQNDEPVDSPVFDPLLDDARERLQDVSNARRWEATVVTRHVVLPQPPPLRLHCAAVRVRAGREPGAAGVSEMRIQAAKAARRGENPLRSRPGRLSMPSAAS